MRDAGYDADRCRRVAALMLKTDLKSDADVQVLEDVACLVFFRWYAGSFSDKHALERVLSIAGKTARKMSANGRAAALALDLPEPVAAAIAGAG